MDPEITKKVEALASELRVGAEWLLSTLMSEYRLRYGIFAAACAVGALFFFSALVYFLRRSAASRLEWVKREVENAGKGLGWRRNPAWHEGWIAGSVGALVGMAMCFGYGVHNAAQAATPVTTALHTIFGK